MKKYTQHDLNKALDKIKQGPIGSKSEAYWTKVTSLDLGRESATSKESRKKAYRSTDYTKYKSIKVTDRFKDYKFKNGHRSKPVQGTNLSTGETFIARNMTEAAKIVGGTLVGVSDVICGGRKSHRNHTFKKLNND